MRPTTSKALTKKAKKGQQKVRRRPGRPCVGRKRLRRVDGTARKVHVSHTIDYAIYEKLIAESTRRTRDVGHTVSMSEIVQECLSEGLN